MTTKGAFNHTYTANYLMSAIAGIGLALLFSFSTGVQIIYEEGQRWQYEDLFAPKPIYVPLPSEKIDSLSRNSASYTPIYQYNQAVLPEKIKEFEENFNREVGFSKKDVSFSDVAKFSNVYKQFGEEMLKKIYEQGVVEEKIVAPTIKINRGDLSTEVASNKVFTIKSAYEFITDSLPFSNLREPEFLYNLLEKKITSNLVFDKELNKSAQKAIRESLEKYRDTIETGELIVKKGKKITPSTFQKLNAYKEQSSPMRYSDSMGMRFLIYALFIVFCLFVLTFHTVNYQPQYLERKNWLIILLVICSINIFHFLVLKSNTLHPLLTPFLVLPILFRQKLAQNWIAMAYLITVIIASQITPIPFPFVIATLLSGLFLIFVKVFDKISFGKIWSSVASLAILAFVFYTLAFQQNVVFDPLSILIFILLNGIMVLLSIFLEKTLQFDLSETK